MQHTGTFQEILMLAYDAVAPIYWHACHQQGIDQVNEDILATKGGVVKSWVHATRILQERADFPLSRDRLNTALIFIANTLDGCVTEDRAVTGSLSFDDVWHMEATGRSVSATPRITPREDIQRMAASQHTLQANAPMPRGWIGRKDPEPAVVLTRCRTGALIQVDMSSLDVELGVSDAIFMVESQHQARHDLHVSHGTFLIALHDHDPATKAAWRRWVPYSEFFYQHLEVLCGNMRVSITAERSDGNQQASASRFGPTIMETPHAIGPVRVDG